MKALDDIDDIVGKLGKLYEREALGRINHAQKTYDGVKDGKHKNIILAAKRLLDKKKTNMAEFLRTKKIPEDFLIRTWLDIKARIETDVLDLTPEQKRELVKGIGNWSKEEEQMEKTDVLDLTPDDTEELRLDRSRYRLAHDNAALTPKQKWELVKDITDSYYRYQAACNISFLTLDQRWELARGIKEDRYRFKVAGNLSTLTPSQQWELVKDIKDGHYRRLAARDVLDLTTDQRWGLIKDIEDEDLRCLAAYHVPGLTDEQKEILRRPAENQ